MRLNLETKVSMTNKKEYLQTKVDERNLPNVSIITWGNTKKMYQVSSRTSNKISSFVVTFDSRDTPNINSIDTLLDEQENFFNSEK